MPAAILPRSSSGALRNRIDCWEGDGVCDAEAATDDGACTLELRVCVNNRDPRYPACAPVGIDGVEVLRPRPTSADPIDQTNVASLEGGIAALGANVDRGGAVFIPGAQISATDVCGPPLALRVPLRVAANGKKGTGRQTFRTLTRSLAIPVDRDRLVVSCRPSTCGNGVVEADHENCDDGNRVDGDGCSRGCRLELP